MTRQLELTTSAADHYRITVGRDLTGEVIRFLTGRYGSKTLLVVIDEQVLRLHGAAILPALEGSFSKVIKYVVPAGEESKNMQQFSHILDTVLEAGIERKTPLLAIGGGVTGDLAGFAAASALRGVPLIHIPTTLLAMVDSSIGGKTGVNHATGKNLIGAFYQPDAVFADIRFLETLPQREWISGLSEILKYGFIRDQTIFSELESLIRDNEFAPPQKWQDIIFKSAAIKADIVQKDVKEAGLREFLNFGHTFAHVLEKLGEYKTYTHGEAVYMGMLAAVYVSNKTGASVSEDLLLNYKSLYNLKLNNTLNPEAMTRGMLHDKKVSNAVIRLILLEEPEKPFARKFEDTRLIDEAWSYINRIFN